MGKVFIIDDGKTKKIYDPRDKIKYIRAFESVCCKTGRLTGIRFERSEKPSSEPAITHSLSYMGQREFFEDSSIAQPGELFRKDGLFGLEIVIGEKLGPKNIVLPLSEKVLHNYDFQI